MDRQQAAVAKRARRAKRDFLNHQRTLAGQGIVELSQKTVALKFGQVALTLPARARIEVLDAARNATVRVRYQHADYLIGVGDFIPEDYELVARILRRKEVA